MRKIKGGAGWIGKIKGGSGWIGKIKGGSDWKGKKIELIAPSLTTIYIYCLFGEHVLNCFMWIKSKNRMSIYVQ